jgi:DNA-binding transcriptional LysR family regulator
MEETKLRDHDCIGYNSSTGRGVWTLTRDDDSRESVELSFVTTSDLMQFSLRAAVGGMGIVLAPQTLGENLVRARRLAPVLRGWRLPGPSLSIVSPSRTFEPLAVTLFKDGLAGAVATWSVPR